MLGWHDEHGVPGARIAMVGVMKFGDASDGELLGRSHTMRIEGESKLTGEATVLATGRLLRAAVDVHVNVTVTFDGRVQKHANTQHTEAALVAACDGPVETARTPALSREERAVDAAGRFAVAVGTAKKDDALRRVAPELKAKHGDLAIWATLRRYVERYGDLALTPPVFLGESALAPDGDGYTLDMSGTRIVAPGSNHRVGVVVHVRLSETPGGFVLTRIVAEDQDHMALLTIDGAALALP
jgi:hypothetical protein